MQPFILSLSTSNPLFVCPQEAIAQKMIDVLALEEERAEALRKIYRNSSIGYRYLANKDFTGDRKDWTFWGQNYPTVQPGMLQRNECYKKEAPKLAQQAASQALQRWGGDPAEITHVISVSCTGVMAPGIEFKLMSELNLNRSVHRLGINFMGCFGAFRGLQVARAFAKEDPSARILLVCTELCSLHLQTDLRTETMVGNSLFADGVAAAVVGSQARCHEKPMFELIKHHSVGLDATLDKMTWDAGDYGFFMYLSSYVPALIKRHIHKLTEPLLKDHVQNDACDWPIHPGGKSILQAVERALNLKPEQTQAAWDVLWNYGNMSSATFLFVLDQLYRQKTNKEWAVGLGFGPGLSMEGILLRKILN